MAKTFYEAIIAHGGFAGQYFDVTQGNDVNQPGPDSDIISQLLSAGDGTLTSNAPVNLISTGALGAPRTLDLSGAEQEGRFFFLSVRNSDITTNSLFILGTTSVNGFGPTAGLEVDAATDYILVHETGGVWRAYVQNTTSSFATIFRDTFTAADWSAGTANRITIIRSGTPVAGQIGPHGLALSASYVVQAYRDSDDQLVDVGIAVNDANGNITLSKTGLGPNFAGRVVVIGG